jgi:hypothetical protein
MGAGEVVLISDSYFLSNEALRKERRPTLLAWVAGRLPTIVFDEEHHGVTEQRNLAGIARKFGLEGVAAGLVLLGALYVWKQAVPFIPRRAAQDRATAEIVGKDAEEGLVRLLRRNIPLSDLLRVCADEWASVSHRNATEEERAHVALVIRAHELRRRRDVVAGYRSIAQELNRRKVPDPT